MSHVVESRTRRLPIGPSHPIRHFIGVLVKSPLDRSECDRSGKNKRPSYALTPCAAPRPPTFNVGHMSRAECSNDGINTRPVLHNAASWARLNIELGGLGRATRAPTIGARMGVYLSRTGVDVLATCVHAIREWAAVYPGPECACVATRVRAGGFGSISRLTLSGSGVVAANMGKHLTDSEKEAI